MRIYPFQIVSKGISREVGIPRFGQQHKGFSPGGAMDQFSYQTGNLLLSNPPEAPAIEIISPPSFQFNRDCYITLTGAHYQKAVLSSDDQKIEELVHGSVFFVRQGSCLTLSGKSPIGFRSYLCFREAEQIKENPAGRSRGSYHSLYRWVDPEGCIRVLEGPEFNLLEASNSFFQAYWKITNDFSNMGFRLSSPKELPKIRTKSMISEAVADGTVQMTPKGPIVLLRERQTIGGYPRVLNVVSADIDQLAQFAPGQILRFKRVSLKEALRIVDEKRGLLQNLKRSLFAD